MERKKLRLRLKMPNPRLSKKLKMARMGLKMASQRPKPMQRRIPKLLLIQRPRPKKKKLRRRPLRKRRKKKKQRKRPWSR